MASSLGEFEGELKRIILFSGDNYTAVNKYYNDLLRSCNTVIADQEYIFTNMVLRIGERLRLLGSTPVEQAAARQWIQYRITRLGITDKREFEEALQELDYALKGNAYLAGTEFGISDLLLYCNAQLCEHLQVEVMSQRLPYRHSNLVRWFDQVQHHYHQHAVNTHTRLLTVITNNNIAGPPQ